MADARLPDLDTLLRTAPVSTPRQGPAAIGPAREASAAPSVLTLYLREPSTRRRTAADEFQGVVFIAGPGDTVAAYGIAEPAMIVALQLAGIIDAALEQSAVVALAKALKLPTPGRPTSGRKGVSAAPGSLVPLRLVFPDRAAVGRDAAILAGIALLNSFRCDPIAAALFQLPDGTRRAVLVVDKPLPDRALSLAIRAAVAPYLKASAHG